SRGSLFCGRSINLNVRLRDRVYRASILFGREFQIPPDRPHYTPVVEIPEIVVNLFHILAEVTGRSCPLNQRSVLLIELQFFCKEIGNGDILRYPAMARNIELGPAVITLIDVLAIKLLLEERAVDDPARNARRPRERRPQRLEVCAIARACSQAVLGAADGRG